MTPTEIRDELIDIAGRTHDKALDERVRRLADKVKPGQLRAAWEQAVETWRGDPKAGTMEELGREVIDRFDPPEKKMDAERALGHLSSAAAGAFKTNSAMVGEWEQIVRAALDRPTLTRKQVEDAINNVSIGEPSRKFVDELANALVGSPLPKPREVDEAEINRRTNLIQGQFQLKHLGYTVWTVIKMGIKEGMSLVAKPKEVSEDQIQMLVAKWRLQATGKPMTMTIEAAIREALSLQGTKVEERHPE